MGRNNYISFIVQYHTERQAPEANNIEHFKFDVIIFTIRWTGFGARIQRVIDSVTLKLYLKLFNVSGF